MSQLRYTPSYTLAEWEQWEGRWELWYGYPVAMTPSLRFDHQTICADLAFLFKLALRDKRDCQCSVAVEHDWRITDNTVVCPDLMVVCKRPKGGWVEDPPELIVEIASPSTRDNDLRGKLDIYRDEGVRHYLVIDPADRRLRRLLGPRDGDDDQSLALPLHVGCDIEIERQLPAPPA